MIESRGVRPFVRDAFAQQLVVRASGMSYLEFLRNVRKAFFGD